MKRDAARIQQATGPARARPLAEDSIAIANGQDIC